MSVRHSSTHKYTEIQSLVVGDEKLGVEDAHSSVAVCDCPAGCAFLTAVYLYVVYSTPQALYTTCKTSAGTLSGSAKLKKLI